MSRLTLSEFIETALDYDWTLESVKKAENNSRLIMTLTAHFGEIILQFDAANFSGETEVIISRKREIIITEKAKNLDFCVGSIAIKFDDEDY